MEEYQKGTGMFAKVHRLTKQARPTVKLVRDKQGHILTEDTEINATLKRVYCENLYTDPENTGHEPVRMGGNLEPTHRWKRWKRLSVQ